MTLAGNPWGCHIVLTAGFMVTFLITLPMGYFKCAATAYRHLLLLLLLPRRSVPSPLSFAAALCRIILSQLI